VFCLVFGEKKVKGRRRRRRRRSEKREGNKIYRPKSERENDRERRKRLKMCCKRIRRIEAREENCEL